MKEKKQQKQASDSITAVKPQKMNASERLEALESTIATQNQQIMALADEVDSLNTKLEKSIVAFSRRLEASIKATASEGAVQQLMVAENVKELEDRIAFLVTQDVLKLNNDAPITDQTFVVGRELDSEGNVINPRLQFAVGSVEKSVQDKILGLKAGDVIVTSTGSDGKDHRMEIIEVYEISLAPKQPDVSTAPDPI